MAVGRFAKCNFTTAITTVRKLSLSPFLPEMVNKASYMEKNCYAKNSFVTELEGKNYTIS